MIASITGTVEECEGKALVVNAGGIGYRVFVGGAVLAEAKEGAKVHFRIYHHVTDAGQSLYGFVERREQEYFELLLGVPSVGPSTARNILDVAPPQTLEQAVAGEDVALLTKVSGVGKRTAERIIVELKERLAVPEALGVPGSLQQETIEALVSIGFTASQARSVVQKLPNDITTVEGAVKEALKQVQNIK